MKKLLAMLLALCIVLSCTAVLADEAEATYTYNYRADVFPTNWNPHQYKTADDNDLALSYLSDGFFSFDYNDTMDGYTMKPHMVVGEPEDVTADYVGEDWGIEAGEEGRAWKYTLRDDLKWQNGDAITAQTYVTSIKYQLNPLAQNYRADSFYSGSVVLHNAEAYAKQGVPADTSLRTYLELMGVETAADLSDEQNVIGKIDWNNSYGDTYDWENKVWTGAAEGGFVETPLTIKELYDFYCTGEGGIYCTWADDETKADWALDELAVSYVWPEIDFEKVGIKALSDTELVFILDQPLQGFQLKYNLDAPLVYEPLYLECESIVDGVYTNSYGTSAETSMSYGPWIMTSFQSDKIITFAKNPNWYGYALEENADLYQTTNIQVDCVHEASTAYEMFLAGQLDTFGLNKDYIEEYATSDYTYYSEGASVFAMAVNPAKEALETNQAAAGENINKTILTLKNFRMALSLGINRAEFILATSPMNAPAFALYGNTIIGNPEEGTFYRNSDEAKHVIVDFWGLTDEVGEGKLYADMDEAIDSISGYNLEMAREYFNAAYDEAIETGLMDEDDVVEIIIGLPSSTSTFYVNGYEYIVNNYTEAVKGTKLEGKLTFKKDDTIGNGFGDALRNNLVDMLFGVGWSGSEFDPYNLMEAYVSTNYQYDRAWDTTTSMLEIELDGKAYTASVYDWYKVIAGEKTELTCAEGTEELALPYSLEEEIAAKRLHVLAALENAVLQNYDFIPLMNDAGANLKGMQIQYYTEDEIYPMGRGGIKYMTYNYTDEEWTAFVAEQGGILNYR